MSRRIGLGSGNLRYFVVFPNGQRFGPADLHTLQLWVAENRVGPATVLEEEGTGRSMPAYTLPQLGFGSAQPSPYAQPGSSPYAQPGPSPYTPPGTSPYSQPGGSPYGQQPQPYSNYYRGNPYAQPVARGNAETIWAFVLGAAGFICCQVLTIGGIILAAIGMSKNQKSAVAALIFCIASLVLNFVVGALFWSIFPN